MSNALIIIDMQEFVNDRISNAWMPIPLMPLPICGLF